MGNYEDDTMRPEMEALKEIAKQKHAERVAKTPDRIEYAKQQFENNKITYLIKNKVNGHIHCYDYQGNLFQFWVSTGKIMYDYKVGQKRKLNKDCRKLRGINNLIKLLIYKE